MPSPLTTGRLCKSADVTRGQLRVYEREGLLSPPERTASGYRNFAPDTLARLTAIRQLKELGFTLAEIAALLSERDNGDIDYAELQLKSIELVKTIDERIAKLKEVRKHVAAVAGGDMTALGDPECGFLVEFLAAGKQSPRKLKPDFAKSPP